MSSAMKFLTFYIIFAGVVLWLSVLANVSILTTSSPDTAAILQPPTSSWDFVNPIYVANMLIALASINSDYALMFTLIITPLILGVIYIGICIARGITP